MMQNYPTIRFKFVLALFAVTFFGMSVGFSVFADGSCRSIDLRRPDLNQPQVQVFTGADGKIADSGMCASFSAALLVSQQLGVSINPVDYAFESTISILSRWDQNFAFGQQGFCAQSSVNSLLGKNQNSFVQVFSDYVHQVDSKSDASRFNKMDPADLKKASQWLSGVCGKRIPERSLRYSNIRLKSTDPETAIYDPPGSMSQAEMGDEIDRLLDEGHFVQYTHSYHAVTIVGRTADCRYIIQDSIPESAWNAFGAILEPGDVYKDAASAKKDLDRIKFQNEIFQYWPRDILIKNAVSIGYVEL